MAYFKATGKHTSREALDRVVDRELEADVYDYLGLEAFQKWRRDNPNE